MLIENTASDAVFEEQPTGIAVDLRHVIVLAERYDEDLAPVRSGRFADDLPVLREALIGQDYERHLREQGHSNPGVCPRYPDDSLELCV